MVQGSTFYKADDSFFLVAVDCVIFGFNDAKLYILAHHRRLEPQLGGLSLMGGFVKEGESINQAATRVLTYLTGMENVYVEQVGAYGEVDRDPAERVISVAYYSLIDMSSYDAQLLEEHDAEWVELGRASEFIFDHPQMIGDTLQIIRRKAALQPIGFNLLPEKFTFTQLQVVYEAIYGHELDKRNFRKKMLSLGFLEKTKEIDKSTSKKGAYYYRFSEDRNLLQDPQFAF